MINVMPPTWDDPTLCYVVCHRCHAAQIFGERCAPAAEVARWFDAHRCSAEIDDEPSLAWGTDDVSLHPRA
jgi:hypothetical protein